jgi:citrate lyase subunit beta/citryl-CoA lyase
VEPGIVSALRSLLRVTGGEDAPYEAARATAADAVLVDLDARAIPRERSQARRAIRHHAHAIAGAGRPLLVRVADTRSHELDADLDATVSESVAAVLLGACEDPQDARDADVAIRQREMRLGIVPGTLRLLCEIDSAAGLAALPRVLDAVDRHAAVVLAPLAIAAELGVPSAAAAGATHGAAEALLDHMMAQTSLAAAAAELPWLLIAPGADAASRAALAARAHQLGATGAVIGAEEEARGANALFAPDPARRASAQAVLGEWERLRAAGRWTGEVDGQRVDRRQRRLAALRGRAFRST